MSIPKIIKIKHNKLPTTPGVYFFRDKKGRVVYVGKATNLKSRVSAYFKGIRGQVSGVRIGRAIDEMLHEVKRIDYQVTDSVIEALILEANLIKKYMPKYNVKEKDDKSFLYVVITKEQWPKAVFMRVNEFTVQKKQCGRFDAAASNRPQVVLRIFGPYTSASSIRAALDLMRKWFPWSDCQELRIKNEELRSKNKLRSTSHVLCPRSCFNYHIGRCPGVCVGAVTRQEYMKNIRNVILMLEGKKARVIKNVELSMNNAAREEKFEEAEMLRRKLFALQHIRDVAVITEGPKNKRSEERGAVNIFGRIEGYDISNISGTSAVGSMVVFQDSEPHKSEYRRFRIKTVQGINDVAMMREVLSRRFSHSERSEESHTRQRARGEISRSSLDSIEMTKFGSYWLLPDLIVIDGGWGQVNVAREVLMDRGLHIPIVGIAKGFKRKQDRPIIYSSSAVEKLELVRIVENYKDLLLRVRDEAHRFAVAYHRKVRSRNNGPLLR